MCIKKSASNTNNPWTGSKTLKTDEKRNPVIRSRVHEIGPIETDYGGTDGEKDFCC